MNTELGSHEVQFSSKAVQPTHRGVSTLWAFLLLSGWLAAQATVIDINSGVGNSNPMGLVNFGGQAYFAAFRPTTGVELYRSGGGTATLVFDINSGINGSNPTDLTVVGSLLFFAADNGVNGQELWVHDGTNTTLVADIRSGPIGSSPSFLTEFNGECWFSADNGPLGTINTGGIPAGVGTELWKSDGTTVTLVKDLFPGGVVLVGTNNGAPENLTVVGGATLFFTAFDTVGRELWKSNGTTVGTVLVKDIFPGVIPPFNSPNNSNPSNLIDFGGTLFFSATNGPTVNGIELWQSDGFSAGTVLVQDINPGGADSNPNSLALHAGVLYFAANDGMAGSELWRYPDPNPSPPMVASLVADIRPGPLGSNPGSLVSSGPLLFFAANDGLNGTELWKSNGTALGTLLVKDINPAPGIGSNPQNLTAVTGGCGTGIIFAANDGTVGTEPWSSNGILRGTLLIQNINPGSAPSFPAEFLVIGGTVFFAATNAASGRELWKLPTTAIGDSIPPNAICQNISVNLAGGSVTITPAQVDNGSNDACGIASLSLSTTTFTCANVGPNTVTLTVLDSGGFTATCSATVTVVDNTPPVAICQNATVTLNASGVGTLSPLAVNNGSSDACGVGLLIVTPTSFGCGQVGANSVTLTVTDVNGNTSTCSATVTVVDNTPPVAICQNATVTLNSSGVGTLSPLAVNNGSSDACGVGLLIVSPTSFGCGQVGANSVTLTVTDVNGNTSTCSATVTVVDNTPPVAICQNATVTLNASGVGTLSPLAVNNGSSDACGVGLLIVSPTSFGCGQVGANSVTLTVTDVNGNTSTCSATVTVVDNTPPVAICQNATVTLNASGVGTLSPLAVNNGSSDACGVGLLIVSPTSFGCGQVGANSVTLTVTDVNGNTSTCSATVTVVDNTPPVAICQNATVTLNASGVGTLSPLAVNNGSSDACGVGLLIVTPTSFGCGQVGANSVTLTVTDVNGNTSTCSATVTVVDNTPPVAICQNATVTLNASGVGTLSPLAVNNGSSDACGVGLLIVSPTSFGCGQVGANSVTLTVTDVNGNTSTCSATVTVVDNTPPVAICQNATVTLNASGVGTLSPLAVNNGSSDACGVGLLIVSPTSFGCGQVGANSVTLTVTDVNGNTSTCSATVTVVDNTPPVAICQNATVTLNASGVGTLSPLAVNNGSSDACGVGLLIVSPTSFGCGQVGANSVTLTVTDVNGNTSTCSATVTVVDNTPPVAICQNATVTLNASGVGTLSPLAVNNGSSDACGVGLLIVSPTSFGCGQVGANSVTLTVTDVNGNTSTCSATVTVVDNTPPTAVCTNETVFLNASGVGSITPANINNGSSDACGIMNLSVSQSNFNCANVGPNTVTLTVTDNSGNTAQCSATVTVIDNTPPTAVCQAAMLTLNALGSATLAASAVNNGSSDACGIAILSVSPSSFSCANVGTNSVVLTVTDVNGNAATCTATVTVADSTPPIAACQSATLTLSSGTGTLLPSQVNAGSTDACGVMSLSVSPSTFTCANIGSNTVTLTVTDVNGNTSSCATTVNVIGDPPMITSGPTGPTMLCVGAMANFSISATATPPPTFQWRRNGMNIGGATLATFAIAAVTLADAGTYDCVVSSVCGSVTSSGISLTIETIPQITNHPVTQFGCLGSSATFGVTATGGSLTFQWRKNGTPIMGATGSTLAINPLTAADSGSYDVVVTNSCGSATSAAADLVVGGIEGDDPCTCIEIDLTEDCFHGNTNCLVPQAFLLPTGCGTTNHGSKDQWWCYTVTCNGTFKVSTCPLTSSGLATFDTHLSVFSGPPKSSLLCPWTAGSGVFTQLGCNDDAPACFGASTLTVPVTLGQTIYVRVAGKNPSECGPYILDAEFTSSMVLQIHQPTGPGSLALTNTGGPPGAFYFTAITTDPANGGGGLGSGWWFGLHIDLPSLIVEATWPGGIPFTGFLDGSGGSNFALFGLGSFNMRVIYGVTVAFDATLKPICWSPAVSSGPLQ